MPEVLQCYSFEIQSEREKLLPLILGPPFRFLEQVCNSEVKLLYHSLEGCEVK